MEDNVDPIPAEMSIEEAGDFWDTHSVADYPSHLVEMEFKPRSKETFVAVENSLLRDLRERSRKAGVSVETLVNLWIRERLAAPV